MDIISIFFFFFLTLTTSAPSVTSRTTNPRNLHINICGRRTQSACSVTKPVTVSVIPQQTHTLTHSNIITKQQEEAIEAQNKLRYEYLQVLLSRRTPVPLTVELAKPVTKLSPQDVPPTQEEEEILASAPKANIPNLQDLLKEENLYLTVEEGDQGQMPVLILSLKGKTKAERRPAVVCLHSTYGYKEALRPLLEAYASRGYVAIAVDSRYHGERATTATAYQDALVSAWRTGKTMPFIYDTVWDLIKLADYLSLREDIDPFRIGVTGISLGGLHSWFAAFADPRYAVSAPIIAVQGFRWAIDNNMFQARVDTIKPVFETARVDLGKSEIDSEVVEKVWDRIAPGLDSKFDSPYSIPSIAPRPLIILNGADDPRCPIGGLVTPESNARQAYAEFNSSDNFKIIIEPGVGHELTKLQIKESSDWFDRFLKPKLVS
ncbi:hypothetical protein PIB30_062526 [Stylosanthes scabra]|uniref:Dienelactone hydrolase domain-containing protein n=1 Tax=Stylosanthes scabra TaxID=79078 RepID=A0ABU6QLN2_9FABA|nr:hypothetical protein [Stylosanthes scabra]